MTASAHPVNATAHPTELTTASRGPRKTAVLSGTQSSSKCDEVRNSLLKGQRRSPKVAESCSRTAGRCCESRTPAPTAAPRLSLNVPGLTTKASAQEDKFYSFFR